MDSMETDKPKLSDYTLEEQEKLKEALIRAILQGKEGNKNGLHDQWNAD